MKDERMQCVSEDKEDKKEKSPDASTMTTYVLETLLDAIGNTALNLKRRVEIKKMLHKANGHKNPT